MQSDIGPFNASLLAAPAYRTMPYRISICVILGTRMPAPQVAHSAKRSDEALC